MSAKNTRFKNPGSIIKGLEMALKKEQEKYKKCPVVRDWIPDCETVQGWGYVVIGYSLVEASFKALLHVRGKGKVPATHSLSALFNLLDDEDKTVLREYYIDYHRATIGGNIGAFPFDSLDIFLANLDGDKNTRGDSHIGSFDWRYFLIEEKRSQIMPLASVDYLHEITLGCIRLVAYAHYGRFEPTQYTYSWRMRRRRKEHYLDWLAARMNSGEWDRLGDRLEILWGPDYRGRYDLYLFKGKGRKEYFSEIPCDLALPRVDRRKEIETLLKGISE